MAESSKIEWTDATWNPVTGCSVQSPGCKNCYAMKLAGTRLRNHWSRVGLTRDTAAGPVWTGETRFNAEWLEQPLQWNRARMIFVCAHGDLFHPSVPDEWIDQVFAVMALANHHTFQVLTKQAQRAAEYFSNPVREALIGQQLGQLYLKRTGNPVAEWSGLPLRNVWIGISAEDQRRLDERLPFLMRIHAAVRFLSLEPLLGPMELGLRCENWSDDIAMDPETGAYECCKACDYTGIGNAVDWVIVGGESGRGARPMHPGWVRSLRDQCQAAGVAFHFKQHGEWLATSFCNDELAMLPSKSTVYVRPDGSFHDGAGGVDFFGKEEETAWVGKKAAGRMLDGRTWDEVPS